MLQRTSLFVVLFFCLGLSCVDSQSTVEYRQRFTSIKPSEWVRGGIGSLVSVGNGRGLQLRFRKGSLKEQQRGEKRVTLEPSRTKTLQYTVMFRSGFDFNKGGKLPGFSGGKGTTGCKARVPDGWSARFMWRSGGRLVLYLYDQNRKGNCGTDIPTTLTFQTGKAYRIRETVTVNTPGASNGAVRVWANGEQILSRSGLRLRGRVSASRALVDTFYFSAFYGGKGPTWSPRRDSSVIFSDIVVSS
eukprot:TRINITY_DN2325_c0_g1_i1.p1 TRINITY_DN2325_c0_g1~~TRINITY_DN2325_c0_g1_i1.p1  ORF type:complete len:258 (+),score=55.10 TRINITY_DN2325_c0_g1_i1:40-774(+)